MSKSLEVAKTHLLDNSGLDTNDIQKTLDQLMAHDIDHADLYFESSRTESWILEDGIVKEGSHSIDQGVGVRAISGEKTGFAYSDEIVLPALTNAATAARALSHAVAEKEHFRHGNNNRNFPFIKQLIHWHPSAPNKKSSY